MHTSNEVIDRLLWWWLVYRRLMEEGKETKKGSEGVGHVQLLPISSSIPVIDMEDFPRQSQKLVEACKEWGCFRVINRQIPPNLLSQMKSVVRSLFDLPLDVKRRNVDAIVGSGYVAPNKDNPLYEAFGLYDINSSQALDDFCTQLEASPTQREVIKSYAEALHQLVIDICGKLGESMGLGHRDFVKGWPCQFRINKYHFTQDTVGSSGVCTHTDSGFLTVLQEDDSVGGLEVMTKSGSFVAVDPMPGTLLVNLGDIATVWSNGIFYNVKHRVQCKEPAVRVSIALFLLGPKEEPVEAPAELLSLASQNTPLYAPFTIIDYRKLRSSTGLRAGEALQLVRLKPEV